MPPKAVPNEFGFGATPEEAKKEEKAAVAIQALWKGRENRMAAAVTKNAASLMAKKNKRWNLLQGRFLLLQPDNECILRWCELSYMDCIDNEVSSKVVLNNISGRATPGKSLTVTGPPGSGQEAMMNIFAKQQMTGLTQGDITLNAVNINDVPDFYRKVGFLLMEGGYLPVMLGLTPEEQVSFSASLRINRSDEFRRGRVQRALEIMDLAGDKRYRTLGELDIHYQRRCALAVELVTFPGLLLIHDPTEGLDSSSSYHFMETLQRMGKQTTIICSMDSNELGDCWGALDDLYMLANGKLAYYGHKDNLSPWLRKVGYQLPLETNPGDFIIKLMDDSFEDHDHKTIDRMVEVTYYNDLKRRMNDNAQLVMPPMRDWAAAPVAAENLSWGVQFKTLAMRAIKDNFLSTSKYPSQILLSIFLGVLVGSLFISIDKDILKSDANQVSKLLFTLVVMTVTFTVRPAGLRLSQEKPVIIRELRAGFYGASVYHTLQFLTAMFESFFFVVLMGVLMLGIPGLVQNGALHGNSVTMYYPPKCELGTGAYAGYILDTLPALEFNATIAGETVLLTNYLGCQKRTLIQPGTGDRRCQQSCANTDSPAKTYSAQGGSCEYLRAQGVTIVDCPDESDAGIVFFNHILMLMFAAFCGTSLTYLYTYLLPTDTGALTASVVTDAVFLILCGFLIQHSAIPYMWVWAYYLSQYNYAYRAIIDTEIGRRFTTTKTYTTIEVPQLGGSVKGTAIDFPGTFWLKAQGYEDEEKLVVWECFLCLCVISLVYRLITIGVVYRQVAKTNFVYAPAPTATAAAAALQIGTTT